MIEDPTLLSAHLDGELADAEAIAIELHLASCPECRQELDGLRVARAAVRGLPLLNPPAEIFEPVLSRPDFEAEQTVKQRWLVPVAAAMIAVVVAVGVVSSPPTAEIPIRSVAVQHAAGSAAQPDVLLISIPTDGIAR